MSALLALVYIGKHSFVDVSLAELLSAPVPILLTPPVLGLLIGTVALKLRDTEQVAIAMSFMAGSLLGGLGALLLFWLTPFPGRGFFLHALAGILIGGAIGSMTPFIAFRLGR
jgi:hypothetical protein